MRKTVVILLTIALLLSIAVAASAVSVKAGEEVELTFIVSENPDNAAFATVNLTYPAELEFVKTSAKELTSWDGGDQEVPTLAFFTNGNKGLLFINKGGIATGTEVKATFKVKDGTADGTYTITAATALAGSLNGKNAKGTFKVGPVSVTVGAAGGRLPGDVNDDGKVNGKDANRLLQYLAGWDVTINAANADVNGDGKVNGKDANRLLQYLAGWNVELK